MVKKLLSNRSVIWQVCCVAAATLAALRAGVFQFVTLARGDYNNVLKLSIIFAAFSLALIALALLGNRPKWPYWVAAGPLVLWDLAMIVKSIDRLTATGQD